MERPGPTPPVSRFLEVSRRTKGLKTFSLSAFGNPRAVILHDDLDPLFRGAKRHPRTFAVAHGILDYIADGAPQRRRPARIGKPPVALKLHVPTEIGLGRHGGEHARMVV